MRPTPPPASTQLARLVFSHQARGDLLLHSDLQPELTVSGNWFMNFICDFTSSEDLPGCSAASRGTAPGRARAWNLVALPLSLQAS